MKEWKILVLCLSIIGLIFLSAKKDRFQKVLDKQSEPLIKERLLAFKKGGIEKKVPLDKYDTEKLITYAMSFLTTPHRMGGTTKKGIDCSGFVMAVHKAYDIELPHSSEEQARYGAIIADMDKLKRGDLVFFYDSYKTSHFITHSGIYLGEGEFIHTSSKKGVSIAKIDDPYYWGRRFLFGTRLN
jgi:lipoprotein Spr